MKNYYICLIAIVLIVYALWVWYVSLTAALIIAGALFVGFAMIEGLVALNERKV